MFYSLSVENSSLKRDRDQLTVERNDLCALAERRQQEIERVRTEGQAISKQLEEVVTQFVIDSVFLFLLYHSVQANVAKCEALVKAEDLSSREVSLQYREKRMADEKEFLEGQAKSLMSELNRRNEENIALKREQTAK